MGNCKEGPTFMTNSFRFFVYLGASLGVVMPAGAYECRAASADTPFAGQLAQTVPTSALAVNEADGNKKLRNAGRRRCDVQPQFGERD